MNKPSESFREFIENYTPLSEQDWECISSFLTMRVLKKNEVLLQEGSICRHLYFVEKGLLRYFVLSDGDEVTKFFTIAPYCFTSQYSFNAKIPAKESIQALEESVIWQMTLENTNHLFTLESWNIFARKLIQEVQFFTENILQELQTKTAEERYEQLLSQNSELLERVSLKHLASFLGIAPQSLSRIRRRVLEKNHTKIRT